MLKPWPAALVFLVSAATPAFAQVAPTGEWRTLRESPYIGWAGGGASDGTYCYYAGGYDATSCYRYDPVSDTWLERAPSPQIDLSPMAYCNGYLWTFGTEYDRAAVYRYDPVNNLWSGVLARVSRNEFGSAAAVLGRVIYLFGGYNRIVGAYMNAVSSVDVTDPDAPVVAAKDYYPGGTANWLSVLAAGETYTNRIYLLNGTSVHRYDPFTGENGTWSGSLATCPVDHTGVEGGAGYAFGAKGRVFFGGGRSGGTTLHEFVPGADAFIQRAGTRYERRLGPGVGMTNSGKAYVWMGAASNTTIEEYTLPDYGPPPDPASNVRQVGGQGDTPEAGNDLQKGWTDDRITFQADCTDPDVGQNVRFEVQVKGAADPWSAATTLAEGFSAQGTHSLTYPIPAGGDYHWRYRVMDTDGGVTPSAGGLPSWTEFGSPGDATHVDFRSDQVRPSVPRPAFPIDTDVLVPSLESGPVTFVWDAAADNGPADALRYRIEVAFKDPSFSEAQARAEGAASTQVALNLATSRFNYYWHVGATDIGGNFSGWSEGRAFRVVGDDGIDHAGEDAEKVCGMSAGACSGTALGVLGMLLAGMNRLSRRVTRWRP